MNVPVSPGSFESLGLRPELLRAAEAAGYVRPTPVQAQVIAAVLAGRDVIARADTGTGKTAAFGLPLLQWLAEHPRQRADRGNPVAILVLVPTRELVLQTAEVLTAFARQLESRIRVVSAHGGVSINPQMMALRGGADIAVATPGRLLDLHRQGAVALGEVRALVLDEGDRLLASDFRDEVDQIVLQLPGRRQNLLFSATFPAPLSELASALLYDPLEVDVTREVATAPRIEEHVYVVQLERKTDSLLHLLRERELGQVLVFVSMKKTGDRLASRLNRADVQAAVFHADKSQRERTQCLDSFRAGRLRVLIATDLAGRGIDIEQLGTVVNFELPRSPNDYLHRIGRTGRAGRSGLAISLISATDEQHFRVIEKRIQRRLPREQLAGF